MLCQASAANLQRSNTCEQGHADVACKSFCRSSTHDARVTQQGVPRLEWSGLLLSTGPTLCILKLNTFLNLLRLHTSTSTLHVENLHCFPSDANPILSLGSQTGNTMAALDLFRPAHLVTLSRGIGILRAVGFEV
jgi:hypothetical protein